MLQQNTGAVAICVLTTTCLNSFPSQIVFVNIEFCVPSLMIKVFGTGLCVLGRFPLLLLFFFFNIIYIMTGHGGFEMFWTVCEALSRPSSVYLGALTFGDNPQPMLAPP